MFLQSPLSDSTEEEDDGYQGDKRKTAGSGGESWLPARCGVECVGVMDG